MLAPRGQDHHCRAGRLIWRALAAHHLPVIFPSPELAGGPILLSTVQMPGGVPVATVAIGSGARETRARPDPAFRPLAENWPVSRKSGRQRGGQERTVADDWESRSQAARD